MESSTVELRLFRYYSQGRDGGSWHYMRRDQGYNNSITSSHDPIDGYDVKSLDAEELVAMAARYESKLKKGEKLELVDVTIKTDVVPVPFDQGDILEERRRLALKKLTASDVAALGLEQLAAYDKLKFHNED